MTWLVVLMTVAILSLIAAGFYFELKPARTQHARLWYTGSLAGNLALFIGAMVGFLIFGADTVMAQEHVAEAISKGDISVGMGLAILGAGIPTAGSTIASGIAVGPIGAASLATLSEKPELFGRTLIYLGLAEGIAIYGLVMSILLIQKI